MDETGQAALQRVHQIGLFVFSILLLLVVLELVRREHLKERYALLWLLTAGAGLVIGLFPKVIVFASDLFHFQFLTVVVVTSVLFVLGIVLSFSVVISRLSERNRKLTQEVALMAQRIEDLEKKRE